MVKRLNYIGEFPRILNSIGIAAPSQPEAKILHSVDPWKNFEDGDYYDINHHSDEAFKGISLQAVENMASFGQRSKILRRAFPQAASQFVNGQLDFVLFDSKHQYEDGGRQFVRAAFSPDTIISMAKSSKAILE